jgi:fibronectin type 3 domain-containing protein
LTVRVVDLDLNLSIDEVDTATVTITSTTESVPEILTLTETGVNTSQFVGSITTAPAPAIEEDGILQAGHGDLLTATYRDTDDGTGSPSTTFDTGSADCAGPALATVRVTDVTDESAVVRWETTEPSSGRVEWGSTPTLGNLASHSDLTTSHALTVQPLSECGRFYFRVESTDTHGNTTAMDAGGAPFEFNAFTIPGAILRDGFETATGWTLQGEWQIGLPEGQGTSPGDPATAFEDTTVLGHDLTGLGPHPGDYEPMSTESAISPVIDASALSQVELKFRRWLNARAGATATVEVKQGSVWNIVWSSDGSFGVSDSAWFLQTLDISQYAAGNGSLQIAFKQFGGLGTQMNHAGWNVDRFIVKDGSLPAFDACGGCAGAPTFSGVVSAGDADPCADTGITLSWEEAPAWGTGRPGTYAVYRDTQPGFTPSGANLVAAGITTTTWTDTTAPNDVTLYYIVRAENDETCSAGPNNGGVTDSNEATASARDEVTQPLPADLGETLRAESINTAHLRLTWQPAANAARYHVYRSNDPQGPFTQIGDVAPTLFDDENELGNAFNRYYLVRAADACGNEGP